MTQSSQTASFVEIAARKREPISYGLLALGVAMMALTILWSIRWQGGRDQPVQPSANVDPIDSESAQPAEPKQPDRGDYLPAAIWGAMLGTLLLGAGGFFLTRKPPTDRAVFETRLLLMTVGGVAGILTVLLGFVLAWRWQDDLVRWVNLGATGGAKWVVAALAIFLAGVVITFVSLQLARAEERNSVVLRRVLYGTNAVMTGLLMLLLLAVVNIVVFLKLPENMIATASAFKGLGDPSKELLHGVMDEVKVYLIMPEGMSVPVARGKRYNGLYADCRAMLNACQSENNRIKVIPLSPVSDGDEIRRTMKRLKVPEEQVGDFGMLIGYGKGEDLSTFIPYQELFSVTQEGVLAFQGENRLMTELNFLSGGGQRPVVYFTQSNDEPVISDGGPKKISLRTMRELVGHLGDRKYEVRPLYFERGKRPDLAEAAMVVVVAPRIPFEQDQVDILADYLKPKPGGIPGGKLVALLPAFPEVGSSTVSRTGLEPLLQEYGIDVSEKLRLFSFPFREFRTPVLVPATNSAESRQRDHPLSRFLGENESLLFGNVRPVAAVEAAARRGSFVLNIFATRRGWRTYRDDRFNSDPDAIDEQIRREAQGGTNPTAREKLATNQPVPIAAYVGDLIEDSGQMRERPRILVIGTDWFASDDALRNTRIPQLYIAMMGTMLDFMREKPRGMYIEPRALGTYNLPKDPDAVGLVVLPIGLVVLGILGLGIGVWVARRR